MVITASVSQIRMNIAQFLLDVQKGTRVRIRDEKRNKDIAELKPLSSFNKTSYEAVLSKVAGTFSSESHPEWKTTDAITSWLKKSRQQDERTF